MDEGYIFGDTGKGFERINLTQLHDISADFQLDRSQNSDIIIAELLFRRRKMIIKSSTSLRNDYVTISNLAHEVEEPIYITKNGEGDLVLMSIDAFEKREEMLRLWAKLEVAENSRTYGRPGYTLQQSKQCLEEIYGNRD